MKRAEFRTRLYRLGSEPEDDYVERLTAAERMALVWPMTVQSRATGAIDVWVRPTPENADRVLSALRSFGASLSDLTTEDLTRADTVYQIGVAPSRIDLLTGITGVGFEQAWVHRVTVTVDGQPVAVIGLAELARNKEALGRPQDRADLVWLREKHSAG